MAASKVICQNVQHILSGAQQCKCENRCVNCLKLQSELNEVKMELKSVKEILNILSRDLASVGVRVHNLHEHESSCIAMQPFESWPSRCSTKKTYSEVTACEPYTVTKNHFQLLDNHQENNSPVGVLNKSSQSGKDYSSASRVRSAHVKSSVR